MSAGVWRIGGQEMKNRYGVRTAASSARSVVRSVVSMMTDSIGLGLGIACVVVLLAGRGADEVVEHRSVAAERTRYDSMRITSWKEGRIDRDSDRLSNDGQRRE